MLQIAPRVCWPLDTGAKLRNFHLARTLGESASVSLLAFADERQASPQLDQVYEQVVTVTRPAQYTFPKLLRGLFGSTPLPVLNYTSRKMNAALARLLAENDFDVVQIESIHLMACVSVIRAARPAAKTVCDWHNVESELMQRYAERERNYLRQKYARRTAKLMREYEQRALREFDAHVAVSERDAERLRSMNSSAAVAVIENGVDTAHYDRQGVDAAAGKRILFVGSMDYHANIEGVVSFARDIWPAVHARHPDLVFTIVGRDPAAEVRALATTAGVEVTGTVGDVRPFYRKALLSVVPLKVGGGSRLKILESMAAGVPVISTTLGAEGLAIQSGENIAIADADETTIETITSLVENESRRNSLADSARALVREYYDWEKLGERLLDFYRQQTTPVSA